MTPIHRDPPARGMIFTSLVLLNVILIEKGFTAGEKWYSLLLISLPLVIFMLLKKA